MLDVQQCSAIVKNKSQMGCAIALANFSFCKAMDLWSNNIARE